MWIRGGLGAVLFLVGLVWVGQGTNVLHGSGMSGQGLWAVVGGVLIVVGIALMGWSWRIRNQGTP